MTLPGYEPKDVQVTVTPSEIIVHANVETEKENREREEPAYRVPIQRCLPALRASGAH